MEKLRLETTLTNVGTDWVSKVIPKTPGKYTIIRARALPSGSATEIALRVMEDVTAAAKKIHLEYTMTDDYIDSLEDTFYQDRARSHDSGLGQTVVSVKCDTTGNTVDVLLDIEV